MQVGDDGTMYASIRQGRALQVVRVGEVVTGRVCITQRRLRAEVEHSLLIDGFPSTKKRNTLSSNIALLLAPVDSKVGLCDKRVHGVQAL
jgi:hypothetical protein